jgi:ABC-type bacteriocin/lantibiotic exporter with double-glycine peptidase domain
MKQKSKTYSSFFRPGIKIGIFYQLSTFGLSLLCAWLVSQLLSCAIDSLWRRLAITAILTAVLLLLSALLLKALSYRYNRQKADSLQAFRQKLCALVIDRQIKLSTPGELDTRLQSDAVTISDFYADSFPKGIAAVVTGVVCLALLVWLDIRLAIIFGLLSLTQLLPTIVYEKWAKAIYAKTHFDEESYCNWVEEGLRGIRTLKSYRQEKWFLSRFRGYSQAIIRSGKQAEKTGTVETIVAEFISALLNYGSYLILGAAVLFWGTSIAQVPMLLVLAQQLFSAVESLVESRLAQFQCQSATKRLESSDVTATEVPHSPVILEANRISKRFGDKVVLRELSLSIHQGERIRLLGENGAGKSTLLRILLGLNEPDSGTVRSSSPSIAFSFQEEPSLHLPIQEIFSALIEAGTVNADALHRHVHHFGLTDVLDRTPEACSVGQRKKVYLAIALACQREILVLDEPTNHLDVDSVAYLLDELSQFPGTLLVCTHDSRLTLNWNRTLTLKEGMLYES